MIKIIFVDDSKLVLKSVKNVVEPFITDKKISCEFFNEPQILFEALKLEKNDFDLLFVDINMPFMDGYELVTRIRNIEKYRRKPIIAMTTEISLQSKIKGKACGMNGWISKIAAVDTMRIAIGKYIDKVEGIKNAKK